MSKQDMRAETERLIKEVMERKSVTIKRGDTRIEAVCGKCGAPNRVWAPPGKAGWPTSARNAARNKKRCSRSGEILQHRFA